MLVRQLLPVENHVFSTLHNIVYTKGVANRLKTYLFAKREGRNIRIYTSTLPHQQSILNEGWQLGV